VIFNEDIIAAKDRRHANRVAELESQIFALQVEKQELNGVLQLAEERFQNHTANLEGKYRKLTNLWMKKEAMLRDRTEIKRKVAVMEGFAGRRNFAERLATEGANELTIIAESIDPVARMSKGIAPQTQSTMSFVTAAMAPKPVYGGKATMQNVFIKRITEYEDRLIALRRIPVSILREANDEAQSNVDKIETQLGTTGISVNELVANLGGVNRNSGVGGPLIPLHTARNAAVDPELDEFDRQFARASLAFNRLETLTTVMSRLPLVTPVDNGRYRLTSGFGYRVDPFTGRGALHSGTDLAGDHGTPILATATGKVVRAERTGAYGNMVEIDHGFGIRTRYGHLSAILVNEGDRVGFRQKVGLMGSTGRSTGTHLHYEIWFRDWARDPMKFFHAGRFVHEGS
ncbi:MAG TPA: hypothetical protein DCL48_16985, partial [Alphaproteobacteria bacterium]|nr:hypothetical protein [Alphaproteobacteria bacterium]